MGCKPYKKINELKYKAVSISFEPKDLKRLDTICVKENIHRATLARKWILDAMDRY